MFQERLQQGRNFLARGAWLVLPLFFALYLRGYNLDFGLPYALHIDESRFMSAAVHSLQTGDYNPGWFRQPSLYTYTVLGTLATYFVYAGTRGTLVSVADLFAPPYYYLGRIPVPGEWLAARLLTAALGVLTVVLVARWAGRWAGRWAALGAGLLLALSPQHVMHSHFITVDVLTGLLTLACLAASVQVVERGRVGDYVLAGLLAGLAASAKYNAGLVLLVVPVAHFLRGGARGSHGLLALVGVSAVAGFLIGTPFAVLALPRFLDDLVWELHHNAVLGHAGSEGASGAFYLNLLWNGGDGPLLFLGTLGLLLGLRPGAAPEVRRRTLVLAAFVVPFALLLGFTRVRFDRFVVPLLPPLAVLAGYAIEDLRRGVAKHWSGGVYRVSMFMMIAVFCVAPGSAALQYVVNIGQRDVSLLALDWFVAHVPPGETVAVENFGAPVDPEQYAVVTPSLLIDHDAQWYRENGTRWFIASGANYTRFFKDPNAYPTESAAYRALFADWEEAAHIVGPSVGRPGFEITIYRSREP